ncbi:cobalt transporter CbiM [Methanosarcina sp. Mfa9]|uniref:cobalt transporter CbiM n=1 Tax=Methanosarcina sp. Mfa9 TaxID=3439063 RepID=UPI003F863268
MHISDGVLSVPVITAGWAVTIVLVIFSLWWSKKYFDIAEEIPKFSVMAGAFFVASLIHITIGPTCVHLIFNGLLGVILGPLAYLAMVIGLTLQALLLQHGGVTTIGINSLNVGLPAIICYLIFKKGHDKGISTPLLGAFCGGFAIVITVVLLSISLVTTGEQFMEVAKVAALAHIPIMLIEAAVTGSVVAYLLKVKPEMLPIATEDMDKEEELNVSKSAGDV